MALTVRKTRLRKVSALHIGRFWAKETVLVCPRCKRSYGSEDLRRIVPDGANFGYDVLVYVGTAVFMRHRTRAEIVEELAARNIAISSSQIGCLGQKFIAFLAIAHREAASSIKQAMRLKGGYILHLDATCDGQEPLLMSALDSLSEIVLGNVKLPSEKAENIIPFLERIKEAFGKPIALVHDMGAGILLAVAEVFPGILDFVCHFHFLRDIGEDLLDREYHFIRKFLRGNRITGKLRHHARQLKKAIENNPGAVGWINGGGESQTPCAAAPESIRHIGAYSLVLWALDGKNQGDGYGFPFDRPHLDFVQRLCDAQAKIQDLKPKQTPRSPVEKAIAQLGRDLSSVANDCALRQAIAVIRDKIDLFDRLREAMRVAPKGASQGLNCDGMDEDMQTIEKAVELFREQIRPKAADPLNKDLKKMLKQIDKYYDKLFADPIIVQTPSGEVAIQPQRTNNILERFFRDLKRTYRRRTGNHSMRKALQTMLAQTPLVKNLQNDEYLQILLAGKPNLEQRFAEIDAKVLRRELEQARKTIEKIPPRIKKLIRMPDFLKKLAGILAQEAKSAPNPTGF